MKRILAAISLLGLITLGSFALLPKDTYLLRYNPEKGKSGKMTMDYTMDISMEMMGQIMNTGQTMMMGADLNVIENTGKESTLKVSYDYLAMNMENPLMGSMKYDSRKEENEGMMAKAMEAAMSELLASEIITVSNQLGETVSTEGIVGQTNQAKGSLDMMSLMSMSKFPENPIAIGESWMSTYEDKSSPMKMDMKFILKEVNQGKVYVEFTSTVSQNAAYEAESKEDEVASISGTQDGEFVYEEKTMWLIESVIHQDLAMEVEQMGMRIPMKLKGKMISKVE